MMPILRKNENEMIGRENQSVVAEKVLREPSRVLVPFACDKKCASAFSFICEQHKVTLLYNLAS